MKTTRQPTELAKTVAGGDIREDSAAKRLFQINEIAAWFLKTCVEEFNWMSIQDIVNGWIAKADRRLPPRRFAPKTFTLYNRCVQNQGMAILQEVFRLVISPS